MQIGKDVKVIFNGKELLVRDVEVSYSCDDLPSVSIEGYLPQEIDATTKTTGEKEMARDCEVDEYERPCEDSSYGAHALAKKLVNLGLNDRQKLIKWHELKREDGTLTAAGKELLLTILFDVYEDTVVEALRGIDEATAEEQKKRGF